MRILLGVSGGIAAYKSAVLVRRLQEQGHEVRCALTPAAAAFVAPLTLEVLTGHAVYSESYLAARGQGVEEHIEAAQWADVLCIAPATANTLARLALGLADDFVSTTVLAFDGPIYVAPAMHDQMWSQAAVRENVSRLESRGVRFLGPEKGALASGEEGWGRMMEPEDIVPRLSGPADSAWNGRKVVVSAGPTHENLDPVRFLGNRSSGKMGFALASEAARRGAETILVAGPVALATPEGVKRVDVTDARAMKAAVESESATADLVVMAAAVCDYRPAEAAPQKLKKRSGAAPPSFELVENPDILLGLAGTAEGAVRVGFAAETQDLETNAASKLLSKKADYLVANDVSRTDIGFESDANEVTVYRRGGDPVHVSRRPKTAVAAALLDLFAQSDKLR